MRPPRPTANFPRIQPARQPSKAHPVISRSRANAVASRRTKPNELPTPSTCTTTTTPSNPQCSNTWSPNRHSKPAHYLAPSNQSKVPWTILQKKRRCVQLRGSAAIRLVQDLERSLIATPPAQTQKERRSTDDKSYHNQESNIRAFTSTISSTHILRLIRLTQRARRWAVAYRRWQRQQLQLNSRNNWNQMEPVNMQRVEATRQRHEYIRFFERRATARVRQNKLGVRLLEHLGLVLAERIAVANLPELAATVAAMTATDSRLLGSIAFREALQEAVCQRLLYLDCQKPEVQVFLPALLRGTAKFGCLSAKRISRDVLCPAAWAATQASHTSARHSIHTRILLTTGILKSPYIAVSARFFTILTEPIIQWLREKKLQPPALPLQTVAALMEGVIVGGIYDRRFIKLLINTVQPIECRRKRRTPSKDWIRILHCLAIHRIQHPKIAGHTWNVASRQKLSLSDRELLLNGVTVVGNAHHPPSATRRLVMNDLYARRPDWDMRLLGRLCLS